MHKKFLGKKGSVVVGMSGGVDSSVATLLLQKQGYQVSGLFMKNWNEKTDAGCLWENDVTDAMRVSEHIGVDFNTIDLSVDYLQHVFTDFVDAYRVGLTPNPDVFCNQFIKFDAFLKHIPSDLEQPLIATGHYAQIKKIAGRYELHQAADLNKDQTYFLYRLNQSQLACALFPIGHLQKEHVRGIARKAGFTVHNKKDSVGICFIGKRPFREFMKQYIDPKKGPIQTVLGDVIGEHEGVWFYTLGQRQGLGIGGIKGGSTSPWYVVGKDLEKNLLIVVQGAHHPMLYTDALVATELNWISGTPPPAGIYQARIRHRQPLQRCYFRLLTESRCHIEFAQQQRAITPGQSVVLYNGSCCIGGGTICGSAH